MKIIKWNGYSFCEDGTVLNKDGSIKRCVINKKGYYISSFYINGRLETHLIHTLIAYLFLGKKPVGYEVDHINNNRLDNRVCNLQYLTKSENNKKSYDSGNRNVSGFNNPNSKFSKEQFELVVKLLEEGKSYGKIVKLTGVGKGTVAKIAKGKHFICKVQRLSKD